MLKLNKPSIGNRLVLKRTKNLIQALVLGAVVLVMSGAVSVSAAVNGFRHNFKAAMTSTDVDTDARGNIHGTLNRRGSVDNQRLTVAVSNLDPDTTYNLLAYLGGEVTPTAVAEFATDRRGRAFIRYIKNSGNQPLPAELDPISNLWELDIVSTNGDVVLQADLTEPRSFSYLVKRAMDNTGFIGSAGGQLQLSGTPRSTKARVRATGLAPLTSYQLMVDGVSVATKTSDRRGKLFISGPKNGLPYVLDIRTVELVDETGANVILTTTGLGIPGTLSTSGQAPVVLGAAADFAVLAGSTITSINATTVNGDLGVAPGSAVTGFPPGVINGDIHAADTAANLAKAALTVAYNDAKGRTLAPVSVAGNLGGQTLAPGLYKSTDSLEVSSGDLVLDAQGDANGIFIFQIASTLTTTVGRQVILIGDAKAANVFWQVGTSATLATTTGFKGTIMADQSITLETGATLDGRALARIGAVTMDGNTITIPAP
jgi:hypothetical protein